MPIGEEEPGKVTKSGDRGAHEPGGADSATPLRRRDRPGPDRQSEEAGQQRQDRPGLRVARLPEPRGRLAHALIAGGRLYEVGLALDLAPLVADLAALVDDALAVRRHAAGG